MAAPWTPHLERRVVEMWGMNASYTEIGDALGMTRSAIAGKLKRLRAEGRVSGRKHNASRDVENAIRRKADLPPRDAIKLKRFAGPEEWTQSTLEVQGVTIAPPHLEGSKDLVDLKPFECRYPFGNGPYRFCAKPTLIGSAWCAYHHLLCCRKPGEVEP